MRVGFAGTPEFAACALAAIREHGYTIPLVLTQPDRPSGRGLAVTPSAVKRFAAEHALALWQPPSLRAAAVQATLLAQSLDVLVVAAYGLILPREVLEWPRHGCLNIHASLLPRWRGAAPVARAIEAGDAASGITIMQMDAGLDTGPIVVQERLALAARETAGTLHERLATLGARMIGEVLRALVRDGRLASTPQASEGVTYANKIGRSDARVDWAQSVYALDRKVRALAPAPGAFARWRGSPVKIRAAVPIESAPAGEPGTVVAVAPQGIDVVCGDGMLRLTELQPAAGRAMPADAFAAGRQVTPGTWFEPGP